jgi:hypothetical protein
MNDTMPTPDALPDKPPKGGGSCCSKIAAFLTVGPELALRLYLGPIRIVAAVSLGRRERPST